MKNSTGLFLKHGDGSKNTKPTEKIICDKEGQSISQKY